jgi:hypothetical protein
MVSVHQVLDRIERDTNEEANNLDMTHLMYRGAAQTVEEDAPDSISPVHDEYFDEAGNDGLVSMMNFSIVEFDEVWAVVQSAMVANWEYGQGRKSKTTAKDAFFMALVILKHYSTRKKHAVDFSLKPPTLEKMMHKVYDIVSPVLFEHYVAPVTMQEQVEANREFRYYPCALYATDVKFQPAHRPGGRFDELKHYFSGKHKQYGLKLECSVAYPGFAVDLSKHYPGSASDLTIFLERQHVLRTMLAKSREEQLYRDDGEGTMSRGQYLWTRDIKVLKQESGQSNPSDNPRVVCSTTTTSNATAVCRLTVS